MEYKPPYQITDKIVNLVANISSLLPMITPNINMKLRKDLKIRSLHSSLAIENNSLSLEQATDVINGRRVAGSPSEIQEVKNAYAAYSQIKNYSPFNIKSFLSAHKTMMGGLLDGAGKFRTQGVGVYDGDRLVHAAPQAAFVHGHMTDLFNWAKKSDSHPLIISSVVHYELELIHPFMDGNGRIGRLWQTVVLGKWDPFFYNLPVETVIYERQKEYYAVLAASDKAGSSTAFIEFMLTAIADVMAMQRTQKGALKKDIDEKHEDKHDDMHIVKHKDKHYDEHNERHKGEHYDELSEKYVVEQLSDTMIVVLKALKVKTLSRKDIFYEMGLANDYRAFKRNVKPLITNGLVEMTLPDKPKSKLQKYRLTGKGELVIK